MTELNEQWNFVRDERKRHSAAFGKLITERQNAVKSVFEVTAHGEQRVTGSGKCMSPSVLLLVAFSLCCGAVLEQVVVGPALLTFSVVSRLILNTRRRTWKKFGRGCDICQTLHAVNDQNQKCEYGRACPQLYLVSTTT